MAENGPFTTEALSATIAITIGTPITIMYRLCPSIEKNPMDTSRLSLPSMFPLPVSFHDC